VKCRDTTDDTLIGQSGDQQTVIARSVIRARRGRAAAALNINQITIDSTDAGTIGPATLAIRADSEKEGTAEAIAWGPQNDQDDTDLGALHVAATGNRRRLARRRTDALYENVSAASNTYDNVDHRTSRIAAIRSRLSRALAAEED
jgi:hypothetical protein